MLVLMAAIGEVHAFGKTQLVNLASPVDESLP